MITRLAFPEHWYADAIARTGEYAALKPHAVAFDGAGNMRLVVPGWMTTHFGKLALPAYDEPLYHRVTKVGGFRIAGQAHYSLTSLELVGTWQSRPQSIGTSPAIYNRDGELLLSQGGGVGVNGYRYISPLTGKPVTGDDTYGPLHGLNEHTDLSDAQDGSLVVGQSNDKVFNFQCPPDSCVVWVEGKHRLIEPGDVGKCRFIRADRDGDYFAFALWKENFGSVIIWMHIDDLRTRPIVEIAAQTPPPASPPKPPAPPATPKEPSVFEPIRFPATAQRILYALYDRYRNLAHGTEEQRRELTGIIARQVRFNLGSKYGWKSSSGVPSKDSIAYRDGAVIHAWDLFNGATREPNDAPMSVDISTQTFIEVEPVDVLGGAATPTPTTPPTTPPSQPTGAQGGATLDAQIAALQYSVGVLTARIQAQNDVIANLPRGGGGGDINGMRIALRCRDNSKLVSADFDRNSEGPLHANRDIAGSWETFTIERQP